MSSQNITTPGGPYDTSAIYVLTDDYTDPTPLLYATGQAHTGTIDDQSEPTTPWNARVEVLLNGAMIGDTGTLYMNSGQDCNWGIDLTGMWSDADIDSLQLRITVSGGTENIKGLIGPATCVVTYVEIVPETIGDSHEE
jgi:hypothetical protein